MNCRLLIGWPTEQVIVAPDGVATQRSVWFQPDSLLARRLESSPKQQHQVAPPLHSQHALGHGHLGFFRQGSQKHCTTLWYQPSYSTIVAGDITARDVPPTWSRSWPMTCQVFIHFFIYLSGVSAGCWVRKEHHKWLFRRVQLHFFPTIQR